MLIRSSLPSILMVRKRISSLSDLEVVANFAYRTDISIAVFLFAGIATFILALGTTFQRAYSVPITNPVDSLRSE